MSSNLSLRACRRALAPTGTYVLIGHDHYGAGGRAFGGLPRFFGLLAIWPSIDRRELGLIVRPRIYSHPAPPEQPAC